MLFNSVDFALFLPLVFALYWLAKKRKLQNSVIVLASAFFYGSWDFRFLLLIIASVFVDYFVGHAIQNTDAPKRRKILLLTSITFNIGLLMFFKYFNFFEENFVAAFSLFGQEINQSNLNIILPVGISFYTFQTMSYTIDVYRRKIEPTKDFIAFSAFVMFFPQLVAGPIERASNLLPQFINKRLFSYESAVVGMRQILWGLFKKIVIADQAAHYVNIIYSDSLAQTGSALVIGTVLFAFQIYCDFSGYSDIAIGTSRLFGVNLKRNFAYPYFSRDIAEFWRKWHMSLTTWFRDYIYIPLGGSRGSLTKKIRNVFIVFLVSGFWHGANWTYVFWGALNALFFVPLLLSNKNRNNLDVVAKNKKFPTVMEIASIAGTFSTVCFSWIFFRSENLSQAYKIIQTICSSSLFKFPEYTGVYKSIMLLLLITLFMSVEWYGRDQEFGIEKMNKAKNKSQRFIIYVFLSVVIYFFGASSNAVEFIYFQF